MKKAAKKPEVNTKTYTSPDYQEPTSYDTSRSESDTPQEIREGEESPAQMDRTQKAKKGDKPTPGAEGVSTSS